MAVQTDRTDEDGFCGSTTPIIHRTKELSEAVDLGASMQSVFTRASSTASRSTIGAKSKSVFGMGPQINRCSLSLTFSWLLVPA